MRSWTLSSLCLLLVAASAGAFQITDAELLALEFSGELLPPPTLVAQIESDLTAIRAVNPYLAYISARPSWAPGNLLLKLTEAAADEYESGQYRDLDEINEQYGAITFRQLSRLWFILKFDAPYHPAALGAEYLKIGSVVNTEPNWIIGDGDDIELAEPGLYRFRRAWGDCQAGCIKEHVWIYRVDAGVVELVLQFGDDYSLPTDASSWTSLKAIFLDQD
jgi:hypothetical protein